MKEMLNNGNITKVSVPLIAVVLILQLVLPYITTNSKTGITNKDLYSQVADVQRSINHLKEVNATQCSNDSKTAEYQEKSSEVMLNIAHALEMITQSLKRIEDRLEK